MTKEEWAGELLARLDSLMSAGSTERGAEATELAISVVCELLERVDALREDVDAINEELHPYEPPHEATIWGWPPLNKGEQ